MSDLSNAIFKDDPRDLDAFKVFVESKGKTIDQAKLENPALYHSLVRRYIDPPSIILPRVEEILNLYENQIDNNTKKPLFDAAAIEVRKSTLELIKKGLLSDPPGVSLYTMVGVAKESGLNIYKCARGTNFVEGGIHQKIARLFASFNAGPELADCIMAEYRHRHNVDVQRTRKGVYPNFLHYDVWILNELKSITTRLFVGLVPFHDWLGTDEFQSTGETFGITTSPRFSSNLRGYLPLSDGGPKMTAAHDYLACKMDTRFPILPIYTKEEKSLFKELYTTNPLQSNEDIMEAFLMKADGQKIFYKAEVHIKSYRKDYLAARNIFNSTIPFCDTREALRAERNLDPVVRAESQEELPVDDILLTLAELQTIIGQDRREFGPPYEPQAGPELDMTVEQQGNANSVDEVEAVDLQSETLAPQPMIHQPSIQISDPARLSLQTPPVFIPIQPATFPLIPQLTPYFNPSLPTYNLPVLSCQTCGCDKCPGIGYQPPESERFKRRCGTCGHTGCKGNQNGRKYTTDSWNRLPNTNTKRPRRKR
jgi:hypothetical protein